MNKANETSSFAEHVSGRRSFDNNTRSNWLGSIEENRQRQNFLNNERR
jgi:hypothetical protein